MSGTIEQNLQASVIAVVLPRSSMYQAMQLSLKLKSLQVSPVNNDPLGCCHRGPSDFILEPSYLWFRSYRCLGIHAKIDQDTREEREVWP